MAGANSWSLPKPRPNGPPFFSRSQISTVLHQVGILLELNGANPFRTRSYLNGSRALSAMTNDLYEYVSNGTLIDIKGIGKGLASGITQAVEDGDWPKSWTELFETTPAGLIEMLGIPNLGPKRIKMMHDELGVENIAELAAAAEAGLIEPMKGFGKKSQQKIIDGIELLHRFHARRRLNIGQRYGEAFEALISGIPGVIKAQLAGSTRRRKETIGDLDIVLAVDLDRHEAVTKSILGLQGIADVKGAGGSKVSLILDTSLFSDGFQLGHIDAQVLDAIGGDAYEQLESGGTIDAQIRLVEPHHFPYTLAYFTGSVEHNIRMRKRAIERGLRLNEFGLIPDEKAGGLKGVEAAQYSLIANDEADIYRHLELSYVVPELREDTGEIEAAETGDLPELISYSNIRGALHNHTTLSDGSASLEQMANAAIQMGWSWLGISDHSQSLKVANGVGPDALLAQGKLIHRLNQQWDKDGTDFRIFQGVESDILAGGKLDYRNEILATLDHVIASVHAITKWRARDEVTNTEELIKTMENPYTTILGHPTGRILQGRDGFPVDMHEVLRATAELINDGHTKAIELNASPYRLDLDWRLCKYAKELGVPISINPDAHSLAGLFDVHHGVQIARKGWLEQSDILNSKSADELSAYFSGQIIS
ncbi:MAG TPA: DNA polymerase/3'-5' exonuclease PolX [Candidatus Poseidoniales archaeon]|nr:DNA polymerase/3'-5' exonuclease PolX [Candidatus Poseidoniales archaeon]